MTPASGSKRLTGKVSASSRVQRQCGYCQQSCPQPQEVRRKGKILAHRGRATVMADDGRVWTILVVCREALATVLGPFQVFLLGHPNCTPISQMRTLRLRELSQLAIIFMSRRQSQDWNLTAASRACALPRCQARVSERGDQTGSPALKATRWLLIHKHGHTSLGPTFTSSALSVSSVSRVAPGM